MAAAAPQEVLSDALKEAIRGRRVRVAVFTTYTFDPGFFELHILPLLFDRPFSQIEKVKLLRLEDELRTVEDVAVYYDRTALSQDARPAQLNFRRIDVRRRTGVFHPKIVLLLVENSVEHRQGEEKTEHGGPLSLVVGTLSANLTRAGWWENVETGHFEEIKSNELDDSRCPYRRDLLSLIQRIRQTAADGEDHSALESIHRFLRQHTPRAQPHTHRVQGKYLTRLFVGQTALPDWLGEVKLGSREWNLEIISPYFDRDHAGALKELIEVLDPRETRVYLPRDVDGSATVTKQLYDSVTAANAHWADLPARIVSAGARQQTESHPPRRVHAKVYRMWRRGGRDVFLTGSVNLTTPAFSHGAAGNLEAAFLVDKTAEFSQTWWLSRLDAEPTVFSEQQPSESDESDEIFIDVCFRYDWAAGQLAYRIDGGLHDSLRVGEPGARVLFELENPVRGKWVNCTKDASDAVRTLLKSTSFLSVRTRKHNWRVLVREEGMNFKPSILATLTPEEILLYWSLLSPSQREAFIEEKLKAEATLEGLRATQGSRYTTHDTVFDRFAGVYHAFERLVQHVEGALERNDTAEAEARLFGEKYDSLPVLLRRTLERTDGDPIISYVTFLSAVQVRDRVRRHYGDFWHSQRRVVNRLGSLLERLPELREQLTFENDPNAGAFLDWYESMFVRTIEQPVVDE